MSVFVGETEGLTAERSCMPAGQGIGGIDEVLPAGEIVRRVVEEARQVDREARRPGVILGAAAPAGRIPSRGGRDDGIDRGAPASG